MGCPRAAPAAVLAMLSLGCGVVDAQLVVAADGSGDHRTIQAAIDAANEGARIVVRAGTYAERLTATKRLVLEGEGWRHTRLLPALDEKENAPVIVVQGAGPVLLRGLRVGLVFTDRGTASGRPRLVSVEGGDLRMQDCAVVGSPGDAVVVTGASRAEVHGSLIGGVWGVGLRVAAVDPGAVPRVEVLSSEIRNCYQRCVAIGSRTDVTISRCRIGGSCWHGIRYDDATPRIRGNLIHDNARFGIYASGETAAEVRGNVFLRNRMSGVSCWFKGRDLIAQNTFVQNGRAAIELLGATAPRLRQNLVIASPVGLRLGNVASGGGEATTTGEVDAVGDVFHAVADPLVGGVLASGLGPKTRTRSPRCRDLEAGDVTLAADSELRAAGVGAPDPLPLASPWPIQSEEVAPAAGTPESRGREIEAAREHGR